jgi:hypothetical protein
MRSVPNTPYVPNMRPCYIPLAPHHETDAAMTHYEDRAPTLISYTLVIPKVINSEASHSRLRGSSAAVEKAGRRTGLWKTRIERMKARFSRLQSCANLTSWIHDALIQNLLRHDALLVHPLRQFI